MSQFFDAIGPGIQFAAPSALVGLVPITGVAVTAMASDSAPAIDIAIIPTWTGLHTFNGNLTVSNTGPRLQWFESDAALNEKAWVERVNARIKGVYTATDAAPTVPVNVAIDISRIGTTVDQIQLAATTIRFTTTTALTVGAAGAATILPALPTGYLAVNVNGVAQKIPYYAP